MGSRGETVIEDRKPAIAAALCLRLLDGDLVRLRIDSEQQLALLDALIVVNSDFGHLETLALI
jgi:hypothetical protein